MARIPLFLLSSVNKPTKEKEHEDPQSTNNRKNEMKKETYFHLGNVREVRHVNWKGYGFRRGEFYVQRLRNGYVTGHLTDRNGWGSCNLAASFHTAQAAADAARKTGVRQFDILHNFLDSSVNL